MAGGNRTCSESKTTEPVVMRDRDFTSDMAVNLKSVSTAPSLETSPGTTLQRFTANAVTSGAELGTATESETGGWTGLWSWKIKTLKVDSMFVSVSTAPSLETSPSTTLQRVTENAVTREAELGTATESEKAGWASLLSWNENTLLVYVILPITLGVAVFVSLVAVHYVRKRCKDRRGQNQIQTKYNRVFAVVPLLKTRLTADVTKHYAGYENRDSVGVGVGGADYHVYERVY
jgi:hypothetical protein